MPDLFVSKKEPKSPPFSPPKNSNSKPIIEPVEAEVENPGVITIAKREIHPFATFHQFPEGVQFENQEKDETIYLFVRRHMITNLGWMVSSALLVFLPIIPLILEAFGLFFLPEIPANFFLVILIFYYLIIFGYVLINTVSWFYNIGLVTQLRVIDIDLSNIQHKNISATVLSDIVDVSYMQKGFLQSFFNYGDVHLQTEGIKENFEFLKVPKPAKVADIISDLIAGRSSDA